MHHYREGGVVRRHEAFTSTHVGPRHVDVWLPPGYDEGTDRYPVVYLHDGQNLFDPALSFSGVSWGVDVALEKLMDEGEVAGAILVGIWNTPKRIPEYMPQRPMEVLGSQVALDRFVETYGDAPLSDAYLAFIARELKPFVDRHYRTAAGRDDTFIMGSSMGGLISLYGICEYPEVFGGAACLSTSWTVAGRVMVPYLKEALPDARRHKLYFDYGVEAHIATYESYQRRVDRLVVQAGYQRDRNWVTARYPGAEHSEAAWRDRVDVPLRLLLHDRRVASSDAAKGLAAQAKRLLDGLFSLVTL